MNFNLPTIRAMVDELAALLIPGWKTTVELAPSVEANQGALAMVYSTPERQLAHVVVAPHPPNESPRESVAHELTHSCLSPLTSLIEWSPAAVMIEEQIVERIGKIIANAPLETVRAMLRALHNPRATSPTIRKRILALTFGRLGKGKKRMLSAEQLTKALEALESGDPEATKAILKELIAAMATGGDAVSERGEQLAARDDAADKGIGSEKDMPPQAREYMRQAKRSTQMMLADSIRLRIHTAKTIDGVVLDAQTEKDLAGATSIEQFEREFRLVSRQAAKSNEQQRKRSGVVAADDKGDENAMKLEDLLAEKIPERQARELVELSKKNRKAADDELAGARIRLRQLANGGA